MNSENWEQIWRQHKGKIVGIGLGIILGILIRLLGFFWAIFVTFLAVVGYYLGKHYDDGQEIDVFETLEQFWQGRRR